MGLFILFAVAIAVIIAVGTLMLIRGLTHPPRLTYAVALARQMPTEPAELGLTAEERTFVFADGAKAPGWIIQGQASQGPALVITHGFGDSRLALLGRIPPLLPLFSRIVVYDLRGHGDSSYPISRLGGREPDDVLEVISQALGSEPVVLLGISMGAGFTIAAAERATQEANIVGVVVEGPYRWPMQPVAKFFERRGIPAQPFCKLAEWHIQFWHGGFGVYDRAALASRLKVPLLVLHGEHDPICPPEAGREIAAAAKRGRYVEFPAGRHCDLHDNHSERYDQAIREFVSELRAELRLEPLK